MYVSTACGHRYMFVCTSANASLIPHIDVPTYMVVIQLCWLLCRKSRDGISFHCSTSLSMLVVSSPPFSLPSSEVGACVCGCVCQCGCLHVCIPCVCMYVYVYECVCTFACVQYVFVHFLHVHIPIVHVLHYVALYTCM